MVETISIGEIAVAVSLIVGLLTGITYLYKMFNKFLKTTFKDAFEGINTKIDSLSKQVDKTELGSCKNFLVVCMAKIESTGNKLDAVEEQRFFENYETYIEKGGNSYIKHKVEELQKRGLL